MQRCREAQRRFRSHPKAARLLEIAARLRDEKKAAAQLGFAIARLASKDPQEAEVARRQLLDAGQAALVILRKTVRDDSGEPAVQAARLLVQANDKLAPRVFAARLLADPPARLRNALCDGLKALAAVAEPEPLRALHAALKDDGAGERWEVADVLCSVLHKRCRGRSAAFNELLGDPAAATVLRTYVLKALVSDDEAAADWARSVAPAVGVLVRGIHGAYFEGTNFGKLLCERLDARLDFSAPTLPFPGGKAQKVSARWTGYIFVARPGNYTIAAEFDDAARLWLDGKLIIDGWGDQAGGEQQATAALRPGYHEMKLEYMNAAGDARLRLTWGGPGFSHRVLAADVLRALPWRGMAATHAP